MSTPGPRKGDVALVALLLLVTVLPYVLSAGGADSAAYAVVGLLQIVPLLWRRAVPVLAFGVVVLGCLVQLWVTDLPILSDVGLFIAFYAVVVQCGWRWLGIAATVVCGAGALIGALDWVGADGFGGRRTVIGVSAVTFVNGLCIAVVAAMAQAGRRRVQLVEQLRQRALDAEHERDQQALIAAQAERSRIAREMHDVVAHALAVIVVQADGAGHALSRTHRPPEVATQALETIGRTARQALGETRALVGVLRAGPDEPALDPAKVLADLPDVVDQLRGSGRRVHLDTGHLDLHRVPDGIGRALLRIAQEGITNSLKHAGPAAQVWVRLQEAEGILRLLVEDDGHGPSGAGDGEGSGLIGMRERVAAHGGRLQVGPRVGGGFRVCAEIPWKSDDMSVVEDR